MWESRAQAYMRAALFQYVENLLEWGDSLFEQPSLEAVEQAASLYEEASSILGFKPRDLGPLQTASHDRSVKDIISHTGTSTSVATLENMVSAGPGEAPVIEREFWPEFRLDYFCLPVNPRLQRLRDTVADRLFKLHHCLDLLGRPRRLPLYDPPIDPGLLADAAAAGLNLSQIVMDAFTPRPHYRFGGCRAIGVSNFTIRHLEELMNQARVAPAVNQVEVHPFLPQRELVDGCREHGVETVAYSPLTKGRHLDHPVLEKTARRLGKSVAQVLIRWSLEQGHGVLPTSSNPGRIRENAQVFDLELDTTGRLRYLKSKLVNTSIVEEQSCADLVDMTLAISIR